MGIEDGLIVEHEEYMQLGKTKELRQSCYLDLFSHTLGHVDIETIRAGTIKDNVIGNEKFKDEIERMLKIRIKKCAHGGDRKSVEFRYRVVNGN